MLCFLSKQQLPFWGPFTDILLVQTEFQRCLQIFACHLGLFLSLIDEFLLLAYELSPFAH